MSEFIRPQVSVEEINENLARVSAEPLERGYGDTLGNSLRRVLLSSLSGAAVEAIQIDGVQHEFTTVEGVYEDVTDIVLNVKGLVFRSMGTGDEAEASISADGPMTVTGGDFEIPAEFELVNPEHVICTLGAGAHLTMRMRIGVGRGYVSGEDNERENDPIGIIHVDSLYSPVRRCAKAVEACRVGRHTDYDRLVLEVETNGSITPRDAVVEAANIINQHMTAFMSLTDEDEPVEDASIFAAGTVEDNVELDKQIEDLDLSVRSYNCLKRAGIHSVRQLVEFSENDLLNIRNFGVKSTKAMKKSLVRALFENDRIKTIDVRAKAIRADVDKVITWAKKGDVASRRLAIAKVGDKDIVREVFEKAAQGMWADRNGGYTRIMKLGPRKGDAAEIVIMELVTEPVKAKAKKAAPKAAKVTKVAEAPVEEPKAEEAPAEEATEESAE